MDEQLRDPPQRVFRKNFLNLLFVAALKAKMKQIKCCFFSTLFRHTEGMDE